MIKLYVTLIFVLATMSLIAQISEDAQKRSSAGNFAIAVGLSASTNGLGGNITAAWNDKLALRLGYEKLDMSFPNAFVLEQNDFTFNVSPGVKAGGLSAIVDYYLLKSVYLSAGVMVTDFHLSANIMSANPLTIGDIEYSPSEMGEMNLAVGPQNKVAPYFGLGFGRNISRKNRIAMSFELGAYHMGSYVVDVSGTQLFEANGDPANQGSITKLNETLQGISWSGIYPVVKLGLSYKIWKK